MATIHPLSSQVIHSPPSCVSFCPQHSSCLAIGTYVLHKDDTAEQQSSYDEDAGTQRGKMKQTRTGSLLLFELDHHNLTQLHEVVLPAAVLDIEWSPHQTQPGLLAVAGSTGSLEFYQLSSTKRLNRQASLQIVHEQELVLDLVWHPVNSSTIGLTLSGGQVLLCHIVDEAKTWSDESRYILQDISTHQLEPWTLAFSGDGGSLFSGGDDMVLQCSHVCEPGGEGVGPVWKDRRLHSAGVTAILPLTEDLLVTGSYDDHIRLIRCAPRRRPVVLQELQLGGGVWRVKMLEAVSDHGYTLLASCMHAGCRIVRLSKSDVVDAKSQDEDGTDKSVQWTFEVLAIFDQHQSMNYGSDAQALRPGETTLTVVSTSFYDRLVCVWQYDQVEP